MIEEHQGIKVCCPEEIAYVNGWINRKTLLASAKAMEKNEYGEFLKNVANNKLLYEKIQRSKK